MSGYLAPKEVAEYLELAEQELAKNSLRTAQEAIEQAILIDSRSAEAFYLLGLVFTKRSRLQKAIVAFQKTLELDPNHSDAAIALSSLLSDLGRYQEGAQVFQKLQKRLEGLEPGKDPKINEKLAAMHLELAREYIRYERKEEACSELQQACALVDNEESFILLIKTKSSLGKKGEAHEIAKTALEKFPASVGVRVQLGILEHSFGNLSQARELWTEASELDPQNSLVAMYLEMLPKQPQENANPA